MDWWTALTQEDKSEVTPCKVVVVVVVVVGRGGRGVADGGGVTLQ